MQALRPREAVRHAAEPVGLPCEDRQLLVPFKDQEEVEPLEEAYWSRNRDHQLHRPLV